MNVLIMGASANKDRYSNRAQKMLTARHHHLFLVNPAGGLIEGLECFKSAREISEPIDTVTIYVGPSRLIEVIDDIISLNPRRIIFNPGTEDSAIINRVKDAKIEVVEACTLVLLSTNQF